MFTQKNCNIPIKEDDLLSGKLEVSNEPYAIAKNCWDKNVKVTISNIIENIFL